MKKELNLKLLFKPIIFFAFILLFGQLSVYAQFMPQRLVCQGEMPDDFKLRYAEKYEETLEKDGKTKGRRAEKRKKEFTALTTLAIDNLFRSGKVLYGDEITQYCNKVLDNLLSNAPELRKELRIYTLRSNEVNAFSTHQGVILVTVGLISRLDNEAQLAFVLAHEIAHYIKKHNLGSYEYNKELFREDIKNRRSSFDEKLLESASYSREAEFEADAVGWEMFIKAGYSPEEAIRTHDLLLHAYLPLCNRQFDYSNVEDDFFKLATKAKEYTYIEVEADEDVDDSHATHPNTFKRKKQLQELLNNDDSLSNNHGSKFMLPVNEFRNVVSLAKREVVYNHLIVNEYIEALMLCDAWLDSSELDKTFLFNARAMSYYGLQCIKNRGGLTNFNFAKLQGGQKSYYSLFKQLGGLELNILACREIWKMYQFDTTNERMRTFVEKALVEMINKKKLKPDFFQEEKEGEKDPEKSRNASCYTCYSAFNSPQVTGLKLKWSELLESNTALKRQAIVEESEKPIEINRMIMFSPRYFGLDMRQTIDDRFLNSDNKQMYMENTTTRIVGDMGIELVTPDSRTERQNLTSDFNNYATLLDWLKEREVFDDGEFEGYLGEDLKQISSTYHADYLSVVMCWNLLERRKFNFPLFAVSVFVPYAFPLYLHWQLTPKSQMTYAFLVMNLKTGMMEYIYVEDFNAKYRDYLFKAHLYNSLNQIRK